MQTYDRLWIKRQTLLMAMLVFMAAIVLIGIAGLAGRSNTSPIAVVQSAAREPNFVSYMLVDADRHVVTTLRQIYVPDIVEERWHTQPPLILHRIARGEPADWILSALDARRNVLMPVMRFTASNNAEIQIDNIVVREIEDGDIRYTVYLPLSGEIWTATADTPDAVLVATVKSELQFPLSVSRNGTMLAVNGTDELLIMNIDGSNVRSYKSPLSPSWVRWSPDGRSLLIGSLDLRNPQSAYIVDIQTGDQTVLANTRLVMPCGTDYVAIVEKSSGFEITRFSPHGEARAILDADALDGFEPVNLQLVQPNSCEWLMVISLRSETRLVHLDSRETISLGSNTRFIGLDGDMLLYQATAGDLTEVRRLELDTVAQPETLWKYPRIYGQIRWLDGATRGLFMDSTRLKLIDRNESSTISLTGATAGYYSLLQD